MAPAAEPGGPRAHGPRDETVSRTARWPRRILAFGAGGLLGFASVYTLQGTRASQVRHTRLESAILQPNLPENRRHLLRVFDSMGPGNVEAVGDLMAHHIRSLEDCTYLPFIEAWLRFDREDALDHAVTWRDRRKALHAVGGAIFLDAAAGRKQEALELIDLEIPGKERGGDRNILKSAYLQGRILGGGAPSEEILAHLDAIPDIRKRPAAAREVVELVARTREIESAMSLADEIAERFASRVADSALSAIIGMLAVNEPARARLWLEAHPNTRDAVVARGELAILWSQSDPYAALEWSLSLDAALRKRAVSGALKSWIERDPEAAAMWARNHLPEDAHHIALPILVHELRFPLPNEAAYWANTSADPKRRVSRLLTVLYPWWKNDTVEADRWTANAELSAAVRDEIEAARETARTEASPAADTESHEGTQ